MDAEIAATLDLDSVTSVKAHPNTVSGATYEVTGIILHVEQAILETLPTTVSGGSTLVLARGAKGSFLLSLHTQSFGGDIEFLLKEE